MRTCIILLSTLALAAALVPARAEAPAANGPPAAKPRPDVVDIVPDNDPAMAKAVAEARATLPAFLATAGERKPGTRGYAVKVGIGPSDNREFVWISPFTIKGDTLTGQLANEPERVKGYFSGQTLKVPLATVVDWTYLEGNKMKGNYSTCALMSGKTAAEKAGIRQQYNLDCAAP